jgi:hypothetical protein
VTHSKRSAVQVGQGEEEGGKGKQEVCVGGVELARRRAERAERGRGNRKGGREK